MQPNDMVLRKVYVKLDDQDDYIQAMIQLQRYEHEDGKNNLTTSCTQVSTKNKDYKISISCSASYVKEVMSTW